MYCPNCSKENPEEQRFCRSCGLGLQTISEVLADELSAPRPADSSLEILHSRRSGLLNPFTYGLLLIALGLIIIGFGKTLLAEQLIADIGTIISVLGIGLLGYSGVSLITRESQRLPQPKVSPERTLAADKSSSLPPPHEPPSISEHTTRQLDAGPDEERDRPRRVTQPSL